MSQPNEEQLPTGPWDAGALAILESWDASWAGDCHAMSANPWTGDVLPRRLVELVSVAVSVACTNLDALGASRHIRAVLATRDELLTIVKMATVMAIHSCSLGAPILLEEAAAAGAALPSPPATPIPACDAIKALGQ